MAPAADDPGTHLAPGFRFHPTDEELVSYYLKRKLLCRPLRVDAIAEVDLYKLEPWDLPALSRIRSRDEEWYFFSPLDRKNASRAGRTNRATAQGYWKTTGKDREVKHFGKVVGCKKTLVFHSGRAPKGSRTNWVMHEYRLDGEDAKIVAEAGIAQDQYVVCRVFQKHGPGPQNGAHYGAPFVEEEWEADDTNGILPVEQDDVCSDEVTGVEVTTVPTEDVKVPPVAMGNEFFELDDITKELDYLPEFNGSYDVLGNDKLSEDFNLELLMNEMLPAGDMVDYEGRVGELNGYATADVKEQISIGGFFQDASQSGEYLELNDFGAFANARSPTNSVSWANGLGDLIPDGWHEITNSSAESSDLTQLVNREELVDSSIRNSLLSEQFGPIPYPIQETNYVGQNSQGSQPSKEINWDEPAEEYVEFYDAFDSPIPLADLRQADGISYSAPIIQPDEYSSVDDANGLSVDYANGLLSPLDGTGYSFADSFNFIQEPKRIYNNVFPSNTTLAPNDLAPSAPPMVSKGIVKKTNSPVDHFAKFLDSIPARPAIAAEFPSSLPNTSDPIQFHEYNVHGNKIHWSDPEIEDLHDRCDMKCCSIAAVLRGGFCLFFLSAVMLLISFQLGVSIYSR